MKYTYLNSGVDVFGADMLVKNIKGIVKKQVIGDFAGIFEHPIFEDYYLAACTDGVGTKIIPLIKKRDTKTIANDLFAMNINDLACCGAKPLFFLDYIALNKLDVDLVSNLIEDLNKVLEKYSCTLLGGETSELGDLILKNNFDISGFLVGAVKKDKLIDKNNVKKGDLVIALESSGAHSNGFSLIRKLYKDGLLSDDLFEKSLAPVRIYYDTVQKLNDKKLVKSCANITGGGILANLERSIPKGLDLKINYDKIKLTPLFKWLLELVGEKEAYSTFNMGVGFCVICSPCNLDEVNKICADYNPFILGEVV